MTVRAAVVSHAAVLAVNAEPFAALGDAGADVTLLAPQSLSTDLRGRVELAAPEGFPGRIVGLPVALGGYRKLLGGQRGIHVIVYRGLSRALDAARPNVVFVEEEPYSFAAAQVARWCRSRKIPFVVHQNQNLPRRLPPPFETIRRRVLQQAAAGTVRNDAARRLLRAAGFDGPIEDFPHAVDPRRYDVAAVPAELPGPVVGFVGRLVPEKGLLELVDALAAMRREGLVSSLLVVGDGPERSAAEARVAAAGVPARFAGARAHDEMPRWYAAMDLVVVPSRPTATWTEQFGRVPIEANAAGVPVLVSDGGELPGTVAATGGGRVYALASPGGLTEALRDLLADEAERARLGRAGAAGVLDRFTHDAVAVRLLRLLDQVRTVRA